MKKVFRNPKTPHKGSSTVRESDFGHVQYFILDFSVLYLVLNLKKSVFDSPCFPKFVKYFI